MQGKMKKKKEMEINSWIKRTREFLVKYNLQSVTDTQIL